MKWFLFTYMQKNYDDEFPQFRQKCIGASTIEAAMRMFYDRERGNYHIIAISDVTGVQDFIAGGKQWSK